MWKIKPDERFKAGSEWDGWHGKIIFAVYMDDTHAERLADTGWVDWNAQWMIGSSTKGLDMQDEQIKSKYGERLKVWRD